MGAWLRYFGYLTGALSLFGLIHQHWHFELWAFSAKVLAFYRTITGPVADAINAILPVSIPNDIIVAWIVVGFGFARTCVRIALDKLRDIGIKFNYAMVTGLIYLTSLAWPLLLIEATRQKDWGGITIWLREIVVIAATSLVFFALNAGLS